MQLASIFISCIAETRGVEKLFKNFIALDDVLVGQSFSFSSSGIYREEWSESFEYRILNIILNDYCVYK